MVPGPDKPRFAQPFTDYEIQERIGAGAMGTVFRARQKKMDRIVALKVLKPGLSRNPQYVDRLRREAQIVARLNHPNIVRGFDLGEEGGYHFFVMEYIDGRSLKDLLREWGRFPEEQALGLGLQIARALEHAYRLGITHRDVKPGNILIDQEGNAKLTDMGLAKGPADATITQGGGTVGTPQYISPEQAKDPTKADTRSDLYSLGATLYHMVTGTPPFHGESLAQVIEQVLYQKADSAGQLNPDLTDGFNLVLRKLLAKDPKRRYQNPSELIADLERIERREAPRIDPRQLESAKPRRGRLFWGIGTAAVALVGLSTWLFAWGPLSAQSENPALLQLRRALEDLGPTNYLGRLQVLEQFKPSGRDEEFERNAQRTKVLGEFSAALKAALAELDKSQETLQRDPLRYAIWLEGPATDAVARGLGVPIDRLPAPLLEDLQRWKSEQSARVAKGLEAQFDLSVQRYRSYLEQDVRSAGEKLIASSERNFAGAIARMRDMIGQYENTTELPLPDKFPAAFKERAQALVELRARILDEPLRLAETAAEALLKDCDERLRLLDDAKMRPRDRLAELERLPQRLREVHPAPEAFPATMSPQPWVAVHARPYQRTLAVQAEVRALDQDALELAVAAVLRVLREEGSVAAALRTLGTHRPATPEGRAAMDQWISVLDGLAAAEVWMGEQLYGRARVGQEVVAQGRARRVAGKLLQPIEEPERAFVVQAGAAPERVLWQSLSRVSVWHAVGQLAAQQPAVKDALEGYRTGIAFYLFLGGDLEAALGLLRPQDSHDATLLHQLVSKARQEDGNLAGPEAELAARYGAALKLHGQGRVEEAIQALEALSAEFGRRSFWPRYQGVVADQLAGARNQLQDQRRLTALAERLPAGAEMNPVGRDGLQIVLVPAKLTGKPPEGFVVRGEALVSEGGMEPFGFATNVSVERGVTAEIHWTLPDGERAARLLVVAVHGHSLILAAPGDGTPVAVWCAGTPATPEACLKPLEQALAAETTAPLPRLLPGASYRVTARLDVRPGRRLLATAELDGIVLDSREFAALAKPVPVTAQQFQLRTCGVVHVKRIELTGSLEEK